MRQKIHTWRKLRFEPTSIMRSLSPNINFALPDLKICSFPSIPSFKLLKVQNLLDVSVSFSVLGSGAFFDLGSFGLSSEFNPGKQSGNWEIFVINVKIFLGFSVLLWTNVNYLYQNEGTRLVLHDLGHSQWQLCFPYFYLRSNYNNLILLFC